ncbi:hypothetical protein ACFQ45_00410 [Rhodanobacter aciditrophus]|uniref:Uncharacterized protein n=1 Tax=Rhodanobacter aciditrophus TaxID=1623218 RepID=A0ABW4AV69_9GAMM
MILQILIGTFVCFLLLVVLLVFFIKHKQRAPYYQLDANGCVKVLREAVEQRLLERDWHVFIGMSVRYDQEIEALRHECAVIDEECVVNTQCKDGKVYVVFSKQGILRLKHLLDEWQHKAEYLA